MARWLKNLLVELLHLGWVLFLCVAVGVMVEGAVIALAVVVALAVPRMGAGGAVLVALLGLPPALLLGLWTGALWLSVMPGRAERRDFVAAAGRLGLTPEVAPDWYAAEGTAAGRRVRVKVARGAAGGGYLPGGLEVSVDAGVGTYATFGAGRDRAPQGADAAWLADLWARPAVQPAITTLLAEAVTGSTVSLSPARVVLHAGTGALPELEARMGALVALADAAEAAPRPTVEGATTAGRLTEALSGRGSSGLATVSNLARWASLLMTGGIAVLWLMALVSGTLSMLR